MILLSVLIAMAMSNAEEPRREVDTSSRIPKSVHMEERERSEVRKIQLGYGECVVKKQREAARHFVLTPDLEGRAWDRAIAKVGDGYCLVEAAKANHGVEMRFPADTMRYALADALVRSEFPVGAPVSLKNAGAIKQPTLDESKYRPYPSRKPKQKDLDELAEARRKQLGLIYLAQFGECVARADTVNSHGLLTASPDSPQESAAFASLKPVLAQCLPVGQTLSFNKATLRGTIAMNFYRLAHAPHVANAAIGATK